MNNNDGLERMRELLKSLDNPERDFKVFHIAGTNGKGSTASMIALMLEKKGYKVGVYTSPHLESFCERFQIWNGEHRMITEDEFELLGQKVDDASNNLPDELKCDTESGITTFERLTAIAYLWFAKEKQDYIILEAGLGGRIDSTNTIEKPLVSVITQVGIDHTEILGKTIFKVAREKAGIIKESVPVVYQGVDPIVKNILISTAKEKNCDFYDAAPLAIKMKGTTLPFKGEHQIYNFATAYTAMQAAGFEPEDLSDVDVPSTCLGRFEIIGENPYWILDGGHNIDAIDAVTDTYTAWARSKKIRRTLIIFGCMKDKNYARMVQLLTTKLKGCNYATVTINDSRAADSELLGQTLADYGKSVICFDNTKEAYEESSKMNYEAILVIGSIYLVGEMRKLLLR